MTWDGNKEMGNHEQGKKIKGKGKYIARTGKKATQTKPERKERKGKEINKWKSTNEENNGGQGTIYSKKGKESDTHQIRKEGKF